MPIGGVPNEGVSNGGVSNGGAPFCFFKTAHNWNPVKVLADAKDKTELQTNLNNDNTPMKLLLHGIDTLQCAHYLKAQGHGLIDFTALSIMREKLRRVKEREPAPIKLGCLEFLLVPHGSSLGFPFILHNEDMRIEFGAYGTPNFLVTYRSQALWRDSATLLHQRFLDWAQSVAYVPYQDETISRVDLCFDYHLEEMDFDEDHFVTLASKDSQHRENGKVQTFTFGKSDIVLRVYDKVAEIKQQSSKVWFYILWGRDSDVWRIEWQLRKSILRRFAIKTLADLMDQQGDLLRYLANEHTTLRRPSKDTNRSRWPLHPMWVDLQARIKDLSNLGVYRVDGLPFVLKERQARLAISVYGYMKRLAAVHCLQKDLDWMSERDALALMGQLLRTVHDPLTWKLDVQKRIKSMELGQW